MGFSAVGEHNGQQLRKPRPTVSFAKCALPPAKPGPDRCPPALTTCGATAPDGTRIEATNPCIAPNHRRVIQKACDLGIDPDTLGEITCKTAH